MKLVFDYRNLNMILPDGSKKGIAVLAPEQSVEMEGIKTYLLNAANNYDSLLEALKITKTTLKAMVAGRPHSYDEAAKESIEIINELIKKCEQ